MDVIHLVKSRAATKRVVRELHTTTAASISGKRDEGSIKFDSTPLGGEVAAVLPSVMASEGLQPAQQL